MNKIKLVTLVEPLTTMVFCILFLTSCSSRIKNNPPISKIAEPYVFQHHLPKHNSKETFVVLAFSGGGTRSSAFSYGVLRKLRDTRVTVDGKTGSLLDEVDVISSVSGGSYTAAYYGLFGKRIFSDYEKKFLKRNIQNEMLSSVLNPVNLLSITRSNYNRGDVAAKWLGHQLFENKTFADMSAGELPYIILNSTDLNTGMTFSFIQQQFDFLCSDINNYPVGHAVMASSAVPVVIAPVTLLNHNGQCTAEMKSNTSWAKQALQTDNILDRRYQVARSLERYFDTKRMPLIRLVDGGVTDNLGVRGSIASPVAHYGNVLEMKGAFNENSMSKIKRVLVIIANAQPYREYPWSIKGKDPSILATISATTNAAIGILNTETISLAKNAFDKWGKHIDSQRGPKSPKVSIHFVPLTFDQIKSSQQRNYVNAIPTNLNLPDKDVHLMTNLAGLLLNQSREFNNFLDSLKP